MNSKHTSLVLLFFMCFSVYFTGCGTFFMSKEKNVEIHAPKSDPPPPPTPTPPPPPTSPLPPPPAPTSPEPTPSAPTPSAPPAAARFIPLTWEFANRIQNSGVELTDLRYFLSNPFAMTVAVHRDTPSKMEVNGQGTLIVSREQNITPRREVFTTTDAGILRHIEASCEVLEVDFNGIPLIFRKNSQGRYDLSSAKIEAITRDFHNEDGLPYLCIFAELNERLEVLAFNDSTPGASQRSAGNDQPPPNRDGGQSQNINYPAGSKQIMGRGLFTAEIVAAYIRSNIRPQSFALNNNSIRELINLYFDEAAYEEINPDIAIAQMLYWTNFLRDQGHVSSRNYGGLSPTREWDGRFRDMTTGVRAHIQHLKGYARPPIKRQVNVDRRYQILENLGFLGSAGTFDLLYEKWSPNNSVDYKNRIDGILDNLYRFSNSN